MDKGLLRKQILGKRDALSRKEIELRSEAIASSVLLLGSIVRAKTIASYISFGNEVETRSLLHALGQMGKKIAVPVIENDGIDFAQFASFESLVTGRYKIPEPKIKKKISSGEIDVFLIPAVAFDLHGQRIGFGKGYYDKYFSEHRPKGKRIGLAFELQIVDKIDHEPHDVKMAMLVTEERILNF